LRLDGSGLKLCYFTENLDGSVRVGEFLEKLGIILQASNRIREQEVQPARIFCLGLRHVPHTHLEVFTVGVNGPNHDLVAKYKFEVDSISRYVNHAIAAGYARQHQDTVLTKCLHAVKDHSGIACRLKNQIERTKLPPALNNWNFLRDYITRAE